DRGDDGRDGAGRHFWHRSEIGQLDPQISDIWVHWIIAPTHALVVCPEHNFIVPRLVLDAEAILRQSIENLFWRSHCGTLPISPWDCKAAISHFCDRQLVRRLRVRFVSASRTNCETRAFSEHPVSLAIWRSLACKLAGRN